jgi:hypothetical protein
MDDILSKVRAVEQENTTLRAEQATAMAQRKELEGALRMAHDELNASKMSNLNLCRQLAEQTALQEGKEKEIQSMKCVHRVEGVKG